MPAPSVGMISNSLKSCSLNGRGRGRGVLSPAVSSPLPERTVEVPVELHSEAALPYHWEQCLDMRTGEVYFRNWTTGKRTTEDPRILPSSSTSSFDNDSSDEDSSEEGSIDDHFIGDLTPDSSSFSSTTTSAYTQEVTSAKSPKVTSSDNQVLVAAGCKSCFMYFMVPKEDSACPKCGRLLFRLGPH